MKLQRLDTSQRCTGFTCNDVDLDDFYHNDSINGSKELLSVTYELIDGDDVVAFFSLSNDSIKKELVPKTAIRRLFKNIPHEKRYSSMPAVKIGRLGTASEKQNSGIGKQLLDYLKVWFTLGNKTGCRFLVVDAYNKDVVISFYKNNDFVFLTGKDAEAKTRIMYYDLIQFKE